MGRIEAICISTKKGTVKRPVQEAVLIEDFGIKGDAHAGKWHRQVSILGYEKIQDFNEQGGRVKDGDFGENLIVSGIDTETLSVGDRLVSGDAVFEVTQRGKECHSHCEIYKRVGKCIMPTEGIFLRVIRGGTLHRNDPITRLGEGERNGIQNRSDHAE
ncbi:MOSC domain-containing protein [Anaerostipes sp.]|uniref:MOSC domain-containing protein n=1 Tax=Anaerostipes sp. TaxID=1872530 RepID=UPI0025C4B692|nr:MOSC domain-containing protein [Anaerostipes sp.]MBS7007772.1 MOSC domain-containing protein [Anaerostipes sp.]